MLLVNTDCLTKKDAEILKAQIEQQAKERRMLELDYKARLKDDMVAMLTEIQTEIEELNTPPAYQDEDYFLIGTNRCSELIQQKIDKLKRSSK